jgi:hypothetical protein
MTGHRYDIEIVAVSQRESRLVASGWPASSRWSRWRCGSRALAVVVALVVVREAAVPSSPRWPCGAGWWRWSAG